MPLDWSVVAKVGSQIIAGLIRIKRKFSVCNVSIESKWTNGTHEAGVTWIHIPVTVKSNWLGKEAIIDAEVDIIEGPISFTYPMPLFWQNRGDTDKPERKMTLKRGNYLIPFAARTMRDSFALSGRAVTWIPANLQDSWLLKKGVVRITNNAHYFTFVELMNFSKRDFYQFVICIKDQGGKTIVERKILLAVPELGVDNRFFYIT